MTKALERQRGKLMETLSGLTRGSARYIYTLDLINGIDDKLAETNDKWADARRSIVADLSQEDEDLLEWGLANGQ